MVYKIVKKIQIINTKIKSAEIILQPINIKSRTYIDFDVENNDKDLKFKIGDHVRISKYKNIFAKG